MPSTPTHTHTHSKKNTKVGVWSNHEPSIVQKQHLSYACFVTTIRVFNGQVRFDWWYHILKITTTSSFHVVLFASFCYQHHKN
jgi:hypothetical protein